MDALELWYWKSPLDYKEIQPVHPKGNQSWMFIWRTDAEAETPILWPPDAKHLLTGKDSDAGKDWGQEEKGITEDEISGWHHRLDRREFEWTPGVSVGQGGLVCCNSWGHRVRHDWATELNWTENGEKKHKNCGMWREKVNEETKLWQDVIGRNIESWDRIMKISEQYSSPLARR